MGAANAAAMKPKVEKSIVGTGAGRINGLRTSGLERKMRLLHPLLLKANARRCLESRRTSRDLQWLLERAQPSRLSVSRVQPNTLTNDNSRQAGLKPHT